MTILTNSTPSQRRSEVQAVTRREETLSLTRRNETAALET